MTKSTLIHKNHKHGMHVYAGFGQYAKQPAPLCVGAKAVYNGKSF